MKSNNSKEFYFSNGLLIDVIPISLSLYLVKIPCKLLTQIKRYNIFTVFI